VITAFNIMLLTVTSSVFVATNIQRPITNAIKVSAYKTINTEIVYHFSRTGKMPVDSQKFKCCYETKNTPKSQRNLNFLRNIHPLAMARN